jgi:hypothetical protein
MQQMYRLMSLLGSGRQDWGTISRLGLYGVVEIMRDDHLNIDRSIRYPVTAKVHIDVDPTFIFFYSFGDVVHYILPDTIETRYAYWYVTYIDEIEPFDIRDISDDLIALLVHTRDTGETWALEDYLTEAGVL